MESIGGIIFMGFLIVFGFWLHRKKQKGFGSELYPEACHQCSKALRKALVRDADIPALCMDCAKQVSKDLKKEFKKAAKNKSKNDMLKLLQIIKEGNANPLLEVRHSMYEYKGGHPDFPDFKKMSLTDTQNGIVAFNEKYSALEGQQVFFTIEWDKITSISADSETITKGNKTLSTIGVLSGRSDYMVAGAASRSSKTTNFLNIGYKGVIDTVISFEGKDAKEAAAYYISAMVKHSKRSELPKMNQTKSV